MKCPKCGFFVSDKLDICKKCGKDLSTEKTKLGMGFLRLSGSRFEKQGGLSVPARSAAPAKIEPAGLKGNEPADLQDEIGGGQTEEIEENALSEMLADGTNELDNPEEFFDFDFGEDVEALGDVLEDESGEEFFPDGSDDSYETLDFPVDDEDGVAVADSGDDLDVTQQFNFDEEEQGFPPELEMSLEVTEEFARETDDDFNFPDIEATDVNRPTPAGVPEEDALAAELEESVSGLKETFTELDDLDVSGMENISTDIPSVSETEMFDEDALSLNGDGALAQEVGERRDSGTVRLDPSEIEEILQTELSLDEEDQESEGRKKTTLMDDNELSQILDEVDESRKPNS